MDMRNFDLSALTEAQKEELASFGASVLNIVGMESALRSINESLCVIMSSSNEELSDLVLFLLELQKSYIRLHERMLENKKTLLGLTGIATDDNFFHLDGKTDF